MDEETTTLTYGWTKVPGTRETSPGERVVAEPGTVVVLANIADANNCFWQTSVRGVSPAYAGALLVMPDGTEVYVDARPDGSWGLLAERGDERVLSVQCLPGEKPHVTRARRPWERARR